MIGIFHAGKHAPRAGVKTLIMILVISVSWLDALAPAMDLRYLPNSSSNSISPPDPALRTPESRPAPDFGMPISMLSSPDRARMALQTLRAWSLPPP